MFVVIDPDRIVIYAVGTQAAADALAADRAELTAHVGDVGSAERGYFLSPVGVVSAAPPETDAQRRAALLADAIAHADDCCDLALPSWYLRASAQDAEAHARYGQTRCWIICAVAVIRAAVDAAWTVEQIEGLRAAQRALMPADPRAIRRWYREHHSAAGQGWTSACADLPGQAGTVRGHFLAGPASRASDPPEFGADFRTPTAWDGTGGRLDVTLQRNAAPGDFA